MANTDKPKSASKKKTDKPKVQYVTKAELEAFKGSVEEGFGKILDILERKPEITETTATEAANDSVNISGTGLAKAVSNVKDADPNGFLPPQYQKVFEKYFDPEDGFTARLMFPEVDEKGNETGGITFTIVVPLKFTNETDSYIKMYKQDLRTRALLPHNIAGGIDAYCKAVANNLHYNRHLKTK